MICHMGLDVGSTTVKLVVLDGQHRLLHSTYRRHLSDVKKTVHEVLKECAGRFKYDTVTMAVTGSGGLGIHEILGVEFVQEVIAGSRAIEEYLPDADVAIELGGEDSKITYFRGSLEQRMNSICAGGTGAFIDQMAALLQTDASGLNLLAQDAQKIYPIASRCGVFAKTDVQALVNQGASRSDIAKSVFQSVVNQTISNLACGRPIRGKVAFLGGPLHFLPELVATFKESLHLSEEDALCPENSQIFVALGAALEGESTKPMRFLDLVERTRGEEKSTSRLGDLPPLFSSEEDYDAFLKRHSSHGPKTVDLKDYEGPMYLGVDAGSTTSKIVLLGEEAEILYTSYGPNHGNPLSLVREKILEILQNVNEKRWIAQAGVTGYGEEFLQKALGFDFGEVETIAHFRAAKAFDPEVDFILDIGGQDMKSMRIRDGVIDSITLNEACSSGCGSFLETFARSIGLSAEEFAKVALFAKAPVDLGSRCTVFMNSLVKKAQKDGAEVGDIAAGLAYSVIKNAIQKVIKIRDPRALGTHIVVQGGTFYSDAVLRTFELLTGREVVRPSLSGLMGAYGMALLAKEREEKTSRLATREEIEALTYSSRPARCRRCTNQCALTVHTFSNGRRFITGNRCEKGAGAVESSGETLPNLYAYKRARLFDYAPLEDAPRGEVGIPRVLNMYENYPFWHAFFTELGYRVILSQESTRSLYEKGMESITSETACYPAKLTHGHIEDLLEKGVNFIFYPSIFYEKRADDAQANILNCPVVAGYPEVLGHNVEGLQKITFLHPFLSFDNEKALVRRLAETFPAISKREIRRAVRAGFEEQERYREDVLAKGEEALHIIEEENLLGVVLAGRPYHVDPEINHGISELMTSLGLAVLSEDSVARRTEFRGGLRVLDQWTYHSRLYRAAKFVGEHDHLEMVQLNSFGCGLDAVTTDQVGEILETYHKIFTVIKIDEVSNLGAIKIRLRSLIEAAKKRTRHKDEKSDFTEHPVLYTKEKKHHTLLIPQMSPIHFSLIAPILGEEGFNVQVLEDLGSHVVEEGLRYVNNDACYPSIFVVGQFIAALRSGEVDPENTTLIISQTGGACRASNYVAFIRKALKDAGFGHVPVLALSAQGIEKHPGINVSMGKGARILRRLVMGVLYGDVIMRLTNATRPYERIAGSANMLMEKWLERTRDLSAYKNLDAFRTRIAQMVHEYSCLERRAEKKPRVGIVGEILVKYLPAANNHLQDVLEAEGVEVVIPDLMDFLMYCFRNTEAKADLLGTNPVTSIVTKTVMGYIESYRKIVRDILSSSQFSVPPTIETLVDYARPYASLGHQYGEGWLLTAEMVELIHMDVPNIVCVQPFGCLPNHVTGKGMIKVLREDFPKANIVPIDYDASASEVNQLNRIKLMLAQARKNLEEKKPTRPIVAKK